MYTGEQHLKKIEKLNQLTEWRAFTIQILRQYFQRVKLKKMPENFMDFQKDFMEKTDGRKFYAYLTPENRQRFNKYLQDFYQKLLERKHLIGNAIREELRKFSYTISDLAKMMGRQGFNPEGQKILENMLRNAYNENGDQGVVDLYKRIAGVEIQVLRNGRYVFNTLTGGGEPMLEEKNQIQGLDYRDDEEGVYNDEFVTGQIRIVGDDVEILDWNSNYKQHGGTEISLKRLKQTYGGEIRAVDCGYKGEDSYNYWQKMLEKGLIDGFYDDNANLHTREINNENY